MQMYSQGYSLAEKAYFLGLVQLTLTKDCAKRAVLQVTAILPGFEISTKFNNYLSISVEIATEIKHNTYALRTYQILGEVKPNLNLLPAFKKVTCWLLHF